LAGKSPGHLIGVDVSIWSYMGFLLEAANSAAGLPYM